MIISHKHKFIFIKTQKTAGTSVEIALSAICGSDDIITAISPEDEKTRKSLGFLSAQNTDVSPSRFSIMDLYQKLVKKKEVIYFNHVSAKKIRRWIGSSIWEDYYKFSIERNPWDKVISHYYWKGGDDRFETIENYLQSRVVSRIKGGNQYCIGNNVAVDHLYQFEDLNGMMQDLTQRLGLTESLQLPKKKAKSSSRTDKRHYRDILNPQDAHTITRLFAREIELLKYQF